MDAEGTQGFAFSVKDDIPSIFPEQYVESITLINELENMKVNAIIGIDPDTGLITRFSIITKSQHYGMRRRSN